MMDFTAWLLRVKCESDSVEFYYYSPSEMFVVLTADQGAMMACFNNRGRIAGFVEKFAHFLSF